VTEYRARLQPYNTAVSNSNSSLFRVFRVLCTTVDRARRAAWRLVGRGLKPAHGTHYAARSDPGEQIFGSTPHDKIVSRKILGYYSTMFRCVTAAVFTTSSPSAVQCFPTGVPRDLRVPRADAKSTVRNLGNINYNRQRF